MLVCWSNGKKKMSGINVFAQKVTEDDIELNLQNKIVYHSNKSFFFLNG